MLVKNLLTTSLLILLATSFTGCFSIFDPEPKVITTTKLVERKIAVVPRPKPVSLAKMKFYVVTADTIDQFVEDFKKKNGELVFVAVSISDYENLSLNIGELRRFINQQKEVIVYYEKAVQPTKEKETNDK